MTTQETPFVIWTGRSGKQYKYWIYPIGQNFKPGAGNYIFAKKTKPTTWTAVYIGETGHLDERFDVHHKMACSLQNGATHIHVHASGDAQARRNEESDLLALGRTSCND